MVRIRFDNTHVYISYCGGEWYVSPLTNAWLWLIGALESGKKIDIKDERKELQDHQHNMSFIIGRKDTNSMMLDDLLQMYHPKKRGLINNDELKLINDTLHLNEMSVTELRNLRDFVVVDLSRSKDIKDWHKMSAITHCIDIKLVEKGEEV